MGLYRNGRKIAGNGKSPYEAAISGGYIGTEKQFYESLGKLDEVMNLQEEIEHIKNTSFSSIFKVKNITLTPELFTNNTYTIQNTHVTEDSILITYYSPTTLDTATELQLVEESVENGIKFTIQNPLETFTVEIDAIVVMNLDEAKDDIEKPTITPDNIANNTTTTIAGYAADARQINPNIDGSYANTVFKQFLQMQQQIQALQNSLNGCSFEIIDGVPHIVWDDEGGGNTSTPDSTITITNQPAGTNVYVGESFHLSVEANSSSKLSYQWRYRANDSDEWTNSTNPTAKTANFTSAITSEVGTNQWQCVISNNDKTMTTDIVMIEVREIPSITITAQPVSTLSVEAESNISISLQANSELSLSYQWQKSIDNSIYSDISNATSSSYTGEVSSNIGKEYYRCKINNTKEEIYSEICEVSIITPSSYQLVSFTPTSAKVGETTNFNVVIKPAITGHLCLNTDAPSDHYFLFMQGAVTNGKGSLTCTFEQKDVYTVDPAGSRSNFSPDDGQHIAYPVTGNKVLITVS